MSRPYIMQVGLPWDHPAVPVGLRELVRVGLDKSTELVTAAGYDTEWVFLTPESGVAALVEALKARKPDGVIIGFGIRSNKDLSAFFEDIVNTIAEHAPGAKFMFNTMPQNGVDSAKRWVPLKDSEA